MTGVASGHRVPVLAVAGGTASGKSTLAAELVRRDPEAVGLIHLDDFYVPAHDPVRGVRTRSASGADTLDWNHPGSMDEPAVTAALDAAARGGRFRLIVVEGLFALSLPVVVARATWRVYVDTPDDIRLARKLLRKIDVLGQDPRLSLLNYLQSGRERHAEYVAPSRARADVVLDGTADADAMLRAVAVLMAVPRRGAGDCAIGHDALAMSPQAQPLAV
jgi:uridine kinase